MAAMIWLAWTPVEDRITGKLTVYPIVCEPGQPGPSECTGGRWSAHERAVFGVTPPQSVVVQFAKWEPAQLTGCVVLDRLNWRCDQYEAKDGDVTYHVAPDAVRFLPRWRWYALKYLGIRP